MTGRIDFSQFKAFLASIPTAGPGGVPGGASAIVKAISASARSRASSGPSPHSGSDASSSRSSSTPASASSASTSASFTGTPASAASAAGAGSGSGAVLPHLARESLLEGLFAYLDKRGYGTLAFRDVFVGVAVLRGLVSRAVVASLLARCPAAVCGVSQESLCFMWRQPGVRMLYVASARCPYAVCGWLAPGMGALWCAEAHRFCRLG